MILFRFVGGVFFISQTFKRIFNRINCFVDCMLGFNSTKMDKNDVKACLRALLSSSKISYNLNSLLMEFKKTEGCDLPLFEFGSPLSFLSTLDDTVKLIGDPYNPEICLVESEKSSHIIHLVDRQRNNLKQRLPHLAHRNRRIIIPNNLQRGCSSQENDELEESETESQKSQKNHPKKQQQSPSTTTGRKLNTPKKNEKNQEDKSLGVDKTEGWFFEDVQDDVSLISTENSSTVSSSFQGYVNEGMKNKLKNLIKNHPDGLWCCDLPQYFSQMYNYELDYREFGYTSLIRMLSELPDVFRCVRPGLEDWILFDASVPPSPKEQKMLMLQTDGHVPEEVKNNLKTVLSLYCEYSSSSEVEMNEVLELYKETFGKELNYYDLGYNNFKSFLRSLEGSILTTFKKNDQIFVSPIPKPFETSSFRWNEALPPITPDDDIFRELFPSDVVGPDEKLIELDLKSHIEVGQLVKVCAAEVWSPGKFFLQFYKYKDSLNSFMNDLQSFYNTHLKKYKMSDATIRSQQVCVGLYTSDSESPEEWNRAKILKVINEKMVSVCFVDYGTVTRVKKSQLRFLHKRFSSLPVQALEAKLSGIRPVQDETRWSVSASRRFLDLLRVPFLEAGIVEVDFNKCLVHVVLYDTVQNPGININLKLVSEKLAIPYNEVKKSNTIQTGEIFPQDVCSETNSEKNEANSTNMDSVFDKVSDLKICGDENNLKDWNEECNLKIQPVTHNALTSNSVAQSPEKYTPQEIPISVENSLCMCEYTPSFSSPKTPIESSILHPPPVVEENNPLTEYRQLQYFLLKQQEEETRKKINLLAIELLANDLTLKEVAMNNPEFALKTATLLAQHYVNLLNSNPFPYPNSYNLAANELTQRQCNQTFQAVENVNTGTLLDSSKSDENNSDERNGEIKETHKLENNENSCVGECERESEIFTQKKEIENEKSTDCQKSEESIMESKEEEAVGIEGVESKEENPIAETGETKKKRSRRKKSSTASLVDSSGGGNKPIERTNMGSKMLYVVTVEGQKYFFADEIISSLTIISSLEVADIILRSKRFDPKYRILNNKKDEKVLQCIKSFCLIDFSKKKKKKAVVCLLPIVNFLPYLEALGCCLREYLNDFNELLKSSEEAQNGEPVS